MLPCVRHMHDIDPNAPNVAFDSGYTLSYSYSSLFVRILDKWANGFGLLENCVQYKG